MASTHTRAGTSGAFGHSGSPETQYQVRGRQTGGSLHRRGANKTWEPTVMASKAVVVHKEKVETALEAKIVAALKRANAAIVANRQAVAGAQFERLEAVQYVKFVSAAEGVRERLVAAGTIW